MTDLNVGKCVANPTCTKVFPIYPLRYAVMPYDKPFFLYNTMKGSTLDGSFPKLDNTAYCLRNLRDEGFIYTYDPNAKKSEQWICYQYNGNAENKANVPGFYKLNINQKDGSLEATGRSGHVCIQIPMNDHKLDKVYMMYIDSPLTLATLKKLEAGGDFRNKSMQEVNVGAWIEAQKAQWKADGSYIRKPPESVKHGIIPRDLLFWNKDYDKKLNMKWSENPNLDDKKINLSNALSGISKLDIHGDGMAFALYDAVGIASELSQLVNFEIAKIKQHSDEVARKEWISNVIDKLTHTAGKNAYNETQYNSAGIAELNGYGGAVLREQENKRRVKAAAEKSVIEDYNEANQFKERQKFKKSLPDIRKNLHNQIQIAGEPHYQWIVYTGTGSFTNALLAYDVLDVTGFQAYQGAVARSVDGLLATTKGTKYLSDLLPASGPTGIMKLALQGHPDIAKHLNASKTADANTQDSAASIKSTEKSKTLDTIDERSGIMKIANATVDGKLKLLAELSLQPTHASRHLSLIITTVLIQENRYGTMSKFVRSVYRLLLEVAEGNAVNKVSLSVNHFTSLMYKATTGVESVHPFKPLGKYTSKTTFFFLNQSDNPFNQVDMTPTPAQHMAQKRLNFWHNAKIGLSGLGTAFSAFNIANAYKDFKDKDKNALTTSLSLAGSLLVGGASVLTVGQVVYAKRANLTKTQTTSQAAKATSDTLERYALGLAIVASITAAITTFVKAQNSNSTTSKNLYRAATFTHLSAGSLAFYQLMAKSNNEMMKKGATYISKKAALRFGAARAAYLLGPGVAIALIAIEAIAFLLEALGAYFEKKKEIYWIEQTIWGIKPNKQWTVDKEKYELHKLFKKPKASLKPTIDTSITPTSNREDVEVVLPGFVPQVSHVEIRKSGQLLGKDITTDQWGNKLVPIIKDKNGTRTITYKNIKYFGKVSVQFWPNRFADPEMYYKTDTDWSLFGPSTGQMNDIHRMQLKNPEYRKRLKANRLPNKN